MAETDAEHNPEETEESKSLLLGRNRINSFLQVRNGSGTARRPSQSSNKAAHTKTNASNEQDNEVGEPSATPATTDGVWQSGPKRIEAENSGNSPHFASQPVV